MRDWNDDMKKKPEAGEVLGTPSQCQGLGWRKTVHLTAKNGQKIGKRNAFRARIRITCHSKAETETLSIKRGEYTRACKGRQWHRSNFAHVPEAQCSIPAQKGHKAWDRTKTIGGERLETVLQKHYAAAKQLLSR